MEELEQVKGEIIDKAAQKVMADLFQSLIGKLKT